MKLDSLTFFSPFLVAVGNGCVFHRTMVLKQWIPACSLGLKSWEMIGKLSGSSCSYPVTGRSMAWQKCQDRIYLAEVLRCVFPHSGDSHVS